MFCCFLHFFSLPSVQDVQNSARKAAETVLLVIDEEGIETLIPELLRGINDSQVIVWPEFFNLGFLTILGLAFISFLFKFLNVLFACRHQ